MYTLKQLELFIDLAQSEKIIETARRFGLSQSAVSMAIKELERLLKEPLYERIGKRLVLNSRGALLMREVKPHVDALKRIYTQMSSDSLQGELRLAASVTIAEYLMPTLISEYMNVNEEVSVSLASANTHDVNEMVRSGEVDLGFIEGVCDEDGFVCETLMRDELVVVTSDRRLRDEGPWFIDQLADRKWILREKGSGTRSVFLSAIAPVDRELNVWMELEQTESIKNFLLCRSECISALPRICVRRELEEGRLFEVSIRAHEFERDFIMISRTKQFDSRLLAHFREYLLNSIGVK